MYNSLRIIFAGTADFAAHHLNALIHSNHNVIGVFTKPDSPIRRINKSKFNAVKLLANKYNLTIFQPYSLQELEIQNIISKLKADIMVVVSYGLILPKEILTIPRFGCINVHGSLLPRWRGAAPIQRALCACDNLTGITIIQMDVGLDTGMILCKAVCKIQQSDTSASLHTKLSQIGPDVLLNTLAKITSGNIKPESQNNLLATYAHKLSKKEAKLNWNLSATLLERYVRAFNPWPVSYFTLAGNFFKVWSAKVNIEQSNKYKPGTILVADKSGIHISTKKDILTLTMLQPAGKKIMSANEFLNSRQKLFIPGNFLD